MANSVQNAYQAQGAAVDSTRERLGGVASLPTDFSETFAEPGLSGFCCVRRWRPAGKPYDGEGRADAAVRIGEAFRVDFRRAPEKPSRPRPPRTVGERVGRACRPEIADQVEHGVVAHRQRLYVGDRQRQPGALQKRTGIAHVGEGDDPGAGAAV